MNRTKQGVVLASSVIPWLLYMLLSLVFYPANSDASSSSVIPSSAALQQHHVFIIFSPENELHSKIAHKISENLELTHPVIIVTNITPDKKIKLATSDTDIIIGIGAEGMKNANTHYPGIKKLFISTDPNKYKFHSNKNRHDSILYMTQPYCRQIAFIHQLNSEWKTISIMKSKEKPIDSKQLLKCANEYGLKVYIVSTDGEDNITGKIKHALHHSDVLLALPDSNIYNSRTVKNILMTSYRYRKPVIAFSKNFVSAGALAAIYSDTESIAMSASMLVERHFYSAKPVAAINYPEKFDISINRQVFRALDIPIPDIDVIRKTLQHNEPGASGAMK